MIRYATVNDASAIPSFTATIKQGSTTLRTLTSSAGSSFVTWDGKDGSGNIQPPGAYTAEISGQANQTITLTRQASHAYTYDRLYRLTREDNAFGPRTYAYDPLGNRLSTATTSWIGSPRWDRQRTPTTIMVIAPGAAATRSPKTRPIA
jgi:YD repeat-containing protein